MKIKDILIPSTLIGYDDSMLLKKYITDHNLQDNGLNAMIIFPELTKTKVVQYEFLINPLELNSKLFITNW